MSAYALKNIPQKNWPIRYDLFNDSPQVIQLEQSSINLQKLPTQDDLPCSDGVPMETEQHRLQMELLINSLKPWLNKSNKGYVSGNMFVYFSPDQVKNEDFKGPDVFVVLGVSNCMRKSWVVWEERKAPDIVIELLSESTAVKDKGHKKRIYQDKLKVDEYYWFDPHNTNDFQGFRLVDSIYQELPLKNNSFISQSLGLKLSCWHGVYQDFDTVWLRWKTLSGKLLLLPEEAETKRANIKAKLASTATKWAKAETQRADVAEQRVEVEAQRAEAEAQRAEVEAQRAETEAQRAEAEAQRAEAEAQRAEVEAQRAEAAERRAERLAQLLRDQGITPD